ncbi:unnamed protein product [Zymoseptoria tritici ST99CH_3D1]|nr:unnamed protein product [Zymoseptoria tritici ST99CH_3D1]
MYELLAPCVVQAEWYKGLSITLMQNAVLQPVAFSSMIRRANNDIQDILGVPENADSVDLNNALALGRMLPSAIQARAGKLMRDSRFQAWLQSPRSCVLAVNGMEHSGNHLCSALTYCIALLRQALDQMQANAIPSSFPRESHSMPGDPLEGTTGVLRSLCVQVLLAVPDPNLLVLELLSRSKLKALEHFDLEALCELFRGLLILVSEKIGHFVFSAMIDEVPHLEQDGHISQFRTALDFSFALNEEVQGGSVTLKILLASQSANDVFDNGYGFSDIMMAIEGLDTLDVDY